MRKKFKGTIENYVEARMKSKARLQKTFEIALISLVFLLISFIVVTCIIKISDSKDKYNETYYGVEYVKRTYEDYKEPIYQHTDKVKTILEDNKEKKETFYDYTLSITLYTTERKAEFIVECCFIRKRNFFAWSNGFRESELQFINCYRVSELVYQ